VGRWHLIEPLQYEKQKKTVGKLAITDMIDWKHRNRLLFAKMSNLSSAFRHVKRGRRMHYGNVAV